ncbi:class D sortase [Erythrobacter oryzae]|uniref:class D sortase n=1 Tax=Erythrobacter oryzae TaxID=3019556 RepID=UPI0025540FBE|nr:class D sortase [Erythrobacter sp. COR-2]
MRFIIAAASLALCVGGTTSLAGGAAVPIGAKLAQHRLREMFELRLKATGQSAPAASALLPRGPSGARAVPALPGNGPVARIVARRLGIDVIVLAGKGTHDELASGPAMIARTDVANPVTVMAAHRDTHFLFIRDLRVGDDVNLQLVNGVTERYRVIRFETVRWDSFAYPLDPSRPLLALTTCFPFGGTEYGGPWRRVAWAERVG